MIHYKRLCAAAALVLGCFWRGYAEEAVPTTLDFSEVSRMEGSWKVTMNLNGREMDFYLNVSNIDGKVGATIDTKLQPESRAIEVISVTPAGVDFEFGFSTGGQNLTMHLILKESAGSLSGELREENGLFSGAVTGKHGSLEESDAQRKSPTETRLRINGKKIRVTFGALEMESDDYGKLSALSDDTIYTYVGSRATKLFTDADLRFGDTIVRTNNVAPNYPGVYSLWLKHNDDKWSLVFNEQPDIWGTQHDSAFDVATISLIAQTTDTAQENFLITLEQDSDGGQLKLAWGNTIWSAQFVMMQ